MFSKFQPSVLCTFLRQMVILVFITNILLISKSYAACSTPSVNDTSRCGAGVIDINISSSGGFFQWYDAGSSGVYLGSSGNTFLTPFINSTDSIFVSQVDTQTTNDYLNFNGSGNHIAIENLFYASTSLAELTVEAWVRTSDAGDQIIASFDRSEYWRLEINGNAAGPGQVGLGIFTDAGQLDFSSISRVDDGQWHHVAAVFDSGYVAIYIDGLLDNSTTSGSLFGSGLTRYGFVGSGSEASSFNGSNSPASYFNGDIDEFKVWSKARSATEISQRYTKCANTYEDGLEIYYKMNGTNTDLTVSDQSRNNNDGELQSYSLPGSWMNDGLNITECISCESLRAGAEIQILNTPKPNLGKDTCVARNSFELSVSGTYTDYLWNDSSTDPTNTINSSGTYYVMVDSNSTTCSGYDTINITLSQSPIVSDTIVCGLGVHELNASSSTGFVKWYSANHTDSFIYRGLQFTSPYLSQSDTFYTSSYDTTSRTTAIQLDGSDDYISIKELYYDSTSYTELTVEAWINTTHSSGQIVSFDRSEYWRFEIGGIAGGAGLVGAGISTDAGILDLGSNQRVDDGQWHHVAMVFDNGDLSIYIDGSLDNSASLGSSFGTGITRYGFIGIGSEADTYNGATNGNYFNGSIDEVRVWDKAKTVQEISNQMNHCLLDNNDSPILYYPFDGNSGGTFHDFFGSIYNAEINNADISNIWINDGPIISGCESECESELTPLAVTINYKPNPDLGNDVCSSNGFNLDAGSGYSSYLWNTGETTQSINIDSTGFYSVTVDTAGTICLGTDDIYVSILSKPTGVDTAKCGPGRVALDVSGSTGQYFWYNSPTKDSLLAAGGRFIPTVNQTDTFYVAAFNNDTTLDAMSFDGLDDYIALDMSYTTQGEISELTLEAWVKTSVSGGGETSNWSIIDFDRSDYYNLYITGDDGRVGFSTTDESGTTDDFYTSSGDVVNDGSWHHIAAVYNGTDKMIYIDGVLVASNSNPHGGANLGIGSTRYGFIGDGSEASALNGTRNNLYFQGEIDEVRIWNSSRNLLQIQQNKDICLTGTENDLAAYYKMENTGTSVDLTDHSNNGNSGTLYNMSGANWIESNQTILCSCGEGPVDTVIVQINPIPNVDLGEDTCVTSPLSLDAGGGFSNYLWKDNSVGQTFSATISEAVWVTVDSIGTPCSGSDTIIVSVGVAADPTVYDAGTCGEGQVELIASGVGTNRWWDQSAGGSLLAIGDSFTTPLITTSSEYYVSTSLASADALSFDGSSDYVAIDDYSYASTGITELTVEAWIRTSDSGDQIIASYDRSEYWRLEVNGSGGGPGQIGFSVRTNTGILDFGSSSRVDDGDWHHIAAVYNNGDVEIYIDGALDNSTTQGTSIGSGTTRYGFIGIGSEADSYDGTSNGSHFNGSIDEFRLWDVARTQPEIDENMDICLNGNESGLQVYFRMDEASGANLSSTSGNGAGEIFGANWINDGELFNCSACGESNRVAVQANIFDEIDSVNYQVSYPGDLGTVVSVTPYGGSGSYDYRETSGIINFSGSHQSATSNLTVPNGGIFDFEIQDENGCPENLDDIETRPTPSSGSLVNSDVSADPLIIPGVNDWFYVTNASNDLMMAINPNGNDLGTVNADVYVKANAATYDGQAYMGRNFVIQPETQPSSNVSIRFYFTNQEFASVDDTVFSYNGTNASINNLAIEKYNGPTEDGIYDPSDATSLVDLAQSRNDVQFGANYIEFNTSSFSEFWLKDGASTGLPIELLFFNATELEDAVQLNWSTATEINNDYFTIERSIDGENGVEIVDILGAGNSTVVQNYTYTDQEPLSGKSYYRLKQTDFDGKFEYSDWVAAEFKAKAKAELNVYPNPNNGAFRLDIKGFDKSETVEVIIFDINGKQYLNEEVNLNNGMISNAMNLNKNLASGLYFIRCSSGTKSIVKRMIKE